MAALKDFSAWIAKIWAPRAPAPARPNGHGLAKLLFSLPDPLIFQALQEAGHASAPTNSKDVMERLREHSEIYFVADPSSMKALRDFGYIEEGPHGQQARLGARTIPFFGYEGSVSHDSQHWGLELRRIEESDLARRDSRALRDQEADLVDQGLAEPAKKSSAASRHSRL